jgi:hypothetical protein
VSKPSRSSFNEEDELLHARHSRKKKLKLKLIEEKTDSLITKACGEKESRELIYKEQGLRRKNRKITEKRIITEWYKKQRRNQLI